VSPPPPPPPPWTIEVSGINSRNKLLSPLPSGSYLDGPWAPSERLQCERAGASSSHKERADTKSSLLAGPTTLLLRSCLNQTHTTGWLAHARFRGGGGGRWEKLVAQSSA